MSREPWISYHAPWKSRLRRGSALYEQLDRFLQACAVDPTPDSATLRVYEELGSQMVQLTREIAGTPEATARALAAVGYRPGPLVEDAQRNFGSGVHRRWASGSSGFLFAWEWEHARPVTLAPLLAWVRERETLPRVDSAPGKTPIDLNLSYWFDIKRPGTDVALFPDAYVQSSLSTHLGLRSTNLCIRYATPELTPELREAHQAIVATLGPTPPRGVLQRISYSKSGNEKRERIA